MSCSVCGSNANCGCISGYSDPALPCCGPGSGVTPGGCCQPIVQPVPTPYYNCAPACPESHVQKITIQSFVADVKIVDSWNVPLCGESAVVNAESLRAILPGSYLWNPTYGYFEITAFNSTYGRLTLQNNCNAGNASAGTNVPSCTEFTVTVPPCDCNTDSQVCVAIDFTAPANGDCLDITLTSTTGLTASDTVQIGTGFYFLQAIKPNDIVSICNQGDGITPGTPVIAKDANDNYQYCLSVVSTNACDRTPELLTTMLGCGSDNVTVPLDGGTEGWVVTLIDPATNIAAYRPVGVSADCTQVTANVAITSGTATYTNIPVLDSGVFSVNDILVFNGADGYHFTVTNISDGTHITGTFSPVPSSNFTIPNAATVCVQSCCDASADKLDAFYAQEHFINDVDGHTINTIGGATSYSTAHESWSVTNSSLTSSLSLLTVFNLVVEESNAGDLISSSYLKVATTLNYSINGGGTQSPSISLTTTMLDPGDDALRNDASLAWLQQTTIAPGATATFEMWATIDVLDQPAGGGGICSIGAIALAAVQTGIPV